MYNNLLDNQLIRKIFGKVEIETIIKKIKREKLKQTEKNYLYRSIRPKLIAANILAQEGILKEINKNIRKDTSIIEYNLDNYGYEIFSLKKKKKKKIKIENLITEILIKYPYPRFIEAIPIIMIKNKINKFKILELATIHGIKNKIGYLLETAFLIKRLDYIEDLLLYLKENKDKKVSLLYDGDYDFLFETSPQRIKKWNLLGRFFDEDFKNIAEVYL